MDKITLFTVGGEEMNEYLTNRQIAFIVFGIVVGFGVMGLPKDVAEAAYTGGWFTLLISTAIAIIFTYIITYLGYVHANKTIYEYCEILTGKTITTILICIYIIYFFISFTMITRMATDTIKLTVLLKTPIWATSLVFLAVVYYAVIKRLQVIGRICEIYGVVIIIAAVLITSAIFTQGKLINMKPFFVADEIRRYIKATTVTIFSFSGIEILSIIPLSKNKNSRKIFKYTALMVVFIGFFYIMVVESCISVMGVDGIIHYEDALYAAIRRVDIRSLQFLRRLDGVFLISWISAIFCTLVLFAYGSIFLASKLFKKINFNILAFIVILMGFLVSQIPSTADELKKIFNIINYSGLLTLIGIPIILFVITKVKKYDKKNQ